MSKITYGVTRVELSYIWKLRAHALRVLLADHTSGGVTGLNFKVHLKSLLAHLNIANGILEVEIKMCRSFKICSIWMSSPESTCLVLCASIMMC